jgi:ligand-binding sensor domain-containing protein/DNA-binding response OmpR family regulator/nitrogen-specific signal transduction histidine kinase
MKQSILILSICFSLTSSLYAYYFRSYQVEDGLSHNSVWAVMQDNKGFLWFGTNDGLNRFDGQSFKTFRKQDNDSLSIGDNFIHCLKEDSQGRFLVGTKKGLYLYDPNFEQFHRVNLNRAKENDASINDIFETPEGEFWIACHGHGLYVLNSDLTLKKHYEKTTEDEALPSNYIWSVIQDYVGNIWLGTVGDGLVHFDPQKEIFTKMLNEPDFELKAPIINSLFCDIDYNLWIGTASEGLFRYNYRTGKVYNYMNNEAFNIKSIIEYSENELIMGCDKGLVTFNRQNEKFRMLNNDFDNMTDNAIFSICQDKEGAFWVGTYFGGVNYFSPTINMFSYYYNSPQNSLRKNIISSFAEDENGKIWVGTYNDGLALFNPKTERFENSHINVGYQNIQDMYFDNGKLYVSFYGQGVNLLDIKNGNIQNVSDFSGTKNTISNFVTTIFKSSKGFFLFSSEEGASKYDPITQKATKVDELNGMPIKDITEDYNGDIWFASHAHGLFRMNSDGTWNSFVHNPDDSKSLPNNNVNCIYQDSKFRIWVGTEGSGLSIFNPRTNHFEHILTEQDGLPSNIIYSVLDDSDGNVWVATGGGLIKIKSDLRSIESFGYLSDVQKIRYNPKSKLRASNNRLYFGGTKGFIALHPKDITSNHQQPLLAITGFQIASKKVIPGINNSPLKEGISQTKSITLERNQSTFSFDFVSLSFISPTQNTYAYMLDGFDTDWNYTNGNKAYYMNIPAGEYVFKVKGSNNDGIWSNTQSIYIKVKPFFFASTLMVTLYIVLGIFFFSYLFLRYKKRIDKKNHDKIYKYQAEKEKEIYEAKIDFFTNIAHEIRTPLSLITAPLENIIISGDGNLKTKNNLDIIKINANRLLELINQLLDFRKVEENMFHFKFRHQDVVKVVRDVLAQYQQSATINGIEITLHVQEEKIKSSIDAEAIYKIVSNLVSNAIKFAKSKIEINIEVSQNNILISVDDDGTGVEKKYLKKIFEPFFQVETKNNAIKTGSGLGLSLSKSLAEKHKGEIIANSEEGKGSLFILKIPIMEKTSELTDEKEILESIDSSTTMTSIDSGLKILIVEDNHDLRNFLVNSLNEDYTVFEAEHGVEALNVVEKENVDVIVSDIMMPEMDGLELCNQLKSDVAYSHIPLILLSAKTDTPTKVEGLNKGADVYMEKPFSFEQLKAQINSIIENRNNIRNNFIQSPLEYFKQNINTENGESAEFIGKLNAYILENLSDEKFTIENLSETFFMSRSNFHKKIKSLTGMTPNDYIKLIRLNQSAQLLASGKYKINEVCYMVGFNTPSYFSKCFYEHFGKLPKEFITP